MNLSDADRLNRERPRFHRLGSSIPLQCSLDALDGLLKSLAPALEHGGENVFSQVNLRRSSRMRGAKYDRNGVIAI